MANRKQSPQSASLLAPPQFGTPGSGYWLPPGSFSSEDEEDDLAGSTFRLIPCASPRPKHHSSSEEEDDGDEEGEGSRDTPGPLTLMAALTATSGRRRVSFADSFGLQLTAVRVYGQEETREGKQVAMDQSLRLNSHVMLVDGIGDGEDARSAGASLYLEPEWQAQAVHVDLLKSLSTTKVELEALEPEPKDPLTARGLVRVLNMTYNKYVSVRRTLDSWQTYSDVHSRYEPKEHDDYSDCFSFLLTVPQGIARPGLRLEFAVRYCTPFAEFWANNGGQNFVLCCRSTAPCRAPVPELSGAPAPELSVDVEAEKNLKSCLKVTSSADKEDLEEVPDNVPSVVVHADNSTMGQLPTLKVNECALVLKDNLPHLTVISPSGNDIYADYKREVVNAESIKLAKDGLKQGSPSAASPKSRVPFLRKRRLVDYKKHKDAADHDSFSALRPESDYDPQNKDVKVLSSNLTCPRDEVDFASIEPSVVEKLTTVTISQTGENEVTELVPRLQPFEVLEGIDDQPNTCDLDNIAICHSPIVSEEVPQDVELQDKVKSRGDADITGFQQVLLEEVESNEQEKLKEPELTHDSEIASLSVKACREQLGFTPVEPLQGSEALVDTTIGENDIDAYLETLLIKERPSEEEFALSVEAERHARLPMNPVIKSEAFGEELDDYSPEKVFVEADVEVGTRDREGQDYYIEEIVQTSLDEDFPLSLCSADVETPIEPIPCEQNIPISVESNAGEHGLEGLLSVEKVTDSQEEIISVPEEHEDFVKSLQPPIEEAVIQGEIDLWPQKHEFDHEPSLTLISFMESPGSGVIPSDSTESSQKHLVSTEVKLQTFDVEDNVSNRLSRSPPRKIIEVASCGDVEDELQQEIMNVLDGQMLYSEELTMEKGETLNVDDIPVYVETKRNVPFLTEQPKTIHKTEDVKDISSNQTETTFLITTREQEDLNRPEPIDVKTSMYVSKIDTFQTEEKSKIEMPSLQVMGSPVMDKDWKPMSVQQLEEEYGSLLAEDNVELGMPSCEKYFESKPIAQKSTQEKHFEERAPIVPEGMLELSLQVSLSPYEPENRKESEELKRHFSLEHQELVEDSANAPQVSEEQDYLQGPVWAETMYVSDSLMYPPLENEVDRMPWDDKSWEPIMEDAKAPVSLHADVPLEAAKNNLEELTETCEETEAIRQAGEVPFKASLENISVEEATEEPVKSFLENEQEMKTVWDTVQETALIEEEFLPSTPKWQACAEVHDESMEQKAQGNVLEEHKYLGELFNEVEIKRDERLPPVEQPILKEQTIYDINKSEDKVEDEKRVVEGSKVEEQIEDHDIIVYDVVEDKSSDGMIDLHSRPTDIHKTTANTEEPLLNESVVDHLLTSQRLQYKSENVGEEQRWHVDEGVVERSVPKASPKEMENGESQREAAGLKLQRGEDKNSVEMQVDQKRKSEREVKFYEDHIVPSDPPPIRIRLRQAVHRASVFLLFLVFLAVLRRYDLTVCCLLSAASLFILWLI